MDLTKPLIIAMNDSDSKVRFASLESMYFLCKSIGEKCLINFNSIFEVLIVKVADIDEGNFFYFFLISLKIFS